MPCLMQNWALTASKHQLCCNWHTYCALGWHCFKMCTEKAKRDGSIAKCVVVGLVCLIFCHFPAKNSKKGPIESIEWKSGGFSCSDMQIRAQNAMSDAELSYDHFKAPIMSQLAYILRIVGTLLQNLHWKGQKRLKYSQMCSCWPCLLDLLPFSSKK